MSEADFLAMSMLCEDAGEHKLFFKVRCFLFIIYYVFYFSTDLEWFNWFTTNYWNYYYDIIKENV
jgi:hypothetical protein